MAENMYRKFFQDVRQYWEATEHVIMGFFSIQDNTLHDFNIKKENNKTTLRFKWFEYQPVLDIWTCAFVLR